MLNEVREADVPSLWLVLLESGCAADKAVKGLPCGTGDLGYASPGEFAVEALDRPHCCRDPTGIEAGILDPLLDEASQSHAEP